MWILRKSITWVLCLVMIAALGCAATNTATAGSEPKITVEANGAEVVGVKHFMKEWQGKERLHIELVIKNTLAEAKRFSAKVALVDSGQTNSALVPRKGKKKDGKKLPAVIQPGKTAKTTLPFLWNKPPKELVIKVAPQ